jgi:hypothetical protein
MSAPAKRHWYQFSLKRLLVFVTFVACLSAIVGYWFPGWHRDQKGNRVNFLIQSNGGYWEDGQRVCLGDSRITKEQLTALLKDLEAFDYQTGLFLDGTVCDDSHIKQIVGLKHLRLLTLANTRITDEGLKEITALKELEWVNVNDDAITDSGLQHLATLPNLEYIDVRGTKVTNEGLKKLRKTFPALGVNRYSGY